MFVKICGTTSEEDALLAVAMGADALGFIFAPSPRQVRPQLVADIVKRLPPEVLTVGVFKDESPERVVHIVRSTGLRAAQIHGAYTADDAVAVRRAIFQTICAFGHDDERVERADEFEPWAVHLDGVKPGGGKVWDWADAERVPEGLRLVLAGGLTPDNVVEAIRATHPWGVDAVSGVEAAPGRKDPVKLRAFIQKAHAAGRELRGTARGEAPRPTPRDPSAPHVYDWQEDGI